MKFFPWHLTHSCRLVSALLPFSSSQDLLVSVHKMFSIYLFSSAETLSRNLGAQERCSPIGTQSLLLSVLLLKNRKLQFPWKTLFPVRGPISNQRIHHQGFILREVPGQGEWKKERKGDCGSTRYSLAEGKDQDLTFPSRSVCIYTSFFTFYSTPLSSPYSPPNSISLTF